MPTLLNDNDVRTLREMKQWFDTFRGSGVANSPYSASIYQPQPTKYSPQPIPTAPYIMIRITGATETGLDDTNGNAVQWEYTAKEVELVPAGYGGWQLKSSGWSGTARSMLEDGNSASGTQANGIDHGGDYPTTFNMIQVQTFPMPAILLTAPDGGGTLVTEAWFFPLPNGEDGTCS